MTEYRPWGSYTILEDQQTYKVKRIDVLPGKRLSYQKHEKRSEHWIVVEGEGIVTLEGREISLSPGKSIDISRMAAHRIMNPGQLLLTFIEVQRGDYCGEDVLSAWKMTSVGSGVRIAKVKNSFPSGSTPAPPLLLWAYEGCELASLVDGHEGVFVPMNIAPTSKRK